MRETKEMYPSWGDVHGVRLGNVKIKDLHDFKEHPFHVVKNVLRRFEKSDCRF